MKVTLHGGICDGRIIDIPDDQRMRIERVNIPIITGDGSGIYGVQYDAQTGALIEELNWKTTPLPRDHPRVGETRTPDYEDDYWPSYEAGYADGYADAERDNARHAPEQDAPS